MPQHDWTMPLELKVSLCDLPAGVETHKTSVKVETADCSSVHYVILPTCVSCSKIGKGRNLPEPAHKLFSHLSIIAATIPRKESRSRKAFPKRARLHEHSSAKLKFRSCVYADRREKQDVLVSERLLSRRLQPVTGSNTQRVALVIAALVLPESLLVSWGLADLKN